MIRFLQRRSQRFLFAIGFILSLCSVTRLIQLWFYPSLLKQYQMINPAEDDIQVRSSFPRVRRGITERRFTSTAVESLIKKVKLNIKNKELGWLFENCFPNTLDTTVDFNIQGVAPNHPDTYVIAGNIDVMSLRDSSVQVHPYLPLMKHDLRLRQLIEGVLLRQFTCIQRDSYANAFYKDINRTSEWKDLDQTEMYDGVHERKWELDSLCYVLRLIYSYWKEINYDLTFFHDHAQEFQKTIRIILNTIKEQRRYNGTGKKEVNHR